MYREIYIKIIIYIKIYVLVLTSDDDEFNYKEY